MSGGFHRHHKCIKGTLLMQNCYVCEEQVCILREAAAACTHTHLQCMASVKCENICLALCFGELPTRVFMTNTATCRFISNANHLTQSAVCVCERGLHWYKSPWWNKVRGGGHRNGVSGAWSRECVCFSFLGKWAMWLDIPGSVWVTPRTSGTWELPRSAKDTQRREPSLRAKTSSSEIIKQQLKSQCRYLGLHS